MIADGRATANTKAVNWLEESCIQPVTKNQAESEGI